MMAGMKIRLSGDVVASGRRAWLAGQSGPAELVDQPVLPLGAPVALGPPDASVEEVQRAVGDLASRDDPVIARALASRTNEPLLCALTVMVNCRAPGIGLTTVAPPQTVSVPGYPATFLDEVNGPWLRALPQARELGADTSVFLAQAAEHGLRVPASWLAGGTWTALWARAHR
jgi:hypothetical protein